MTLKEFVDTNWHRGNVVKLKNGKEYLVKECGENDLIPSFYIIPGRLTTQPGESSGEYRLEDQALLLQK